MEKFTDLFWRLHKTWFRAVYVLYYYLKNLVKSRKYIWKYQLWPFSKFLDTRLRDISMRTADVNKRIRLIRSEIFEKNKIEIGNWKIWNWHCDILKGPDSCGTCGCKIWVVIKDPEKMADFRDRVVLITGYFKWEGCKEGNQNTNIHNTALSFYVTKTVLVWPSWFGLDTMFLGGKHKQKNCQSF